MLLCWVPLGPLVGPFGTPKSRKSWAKGVPGLLLVPRGVQRRQKGPKRAPESTQKRPKRAPRSAKLATKGFLLKLEKTRVNAPYYLNKTQSIHLFSQNWSTCLSCCCAINDTQVHTLKTKHKRTQTRFLSLTHTHTHTRTPYMIKRYQLVCICVCIAMLCICACHKDCEWIARLAI